MANENSSKAALPPTNAQRAVLVVVAPVAGWLIPGAGHLIQKRWGRGSLLLLAIGALFLVGLGQQGKLYGFNTGDLLDILGFLGDVGAGLLYAGARMTDLGQGAVHRATADYGTKFMIVAGLLNIVSAIDAYHIAIRKKP